MYVILSLDVIVQTKFQVEVVFKEFQCNSRLCSAARSVSNCYQHHYLNNYGKRNSSRMVHINNILQLSDCCRWIIQTRVAKVTDGIYNNKLSNSINTGINFNYRQFGSVCLGVVAVDAELDCNRVTMYNYSLWCCGL